MSARGNSTRLSPRVRKELEAKFAGGGFTSARALTGWLTRHGYKLGRASLRRDHQAAVLDTERVSAPVAAARAPVLADDAPVLERKLAAVRRATEQARAFLAAAPDDEAAVSDALIRLVQQIDLEILLQLDAAGLSETDPRALADITRSVATLARASLQQKRWIAETRARLEAQVAAAGAQVADATRQGGLSDAAAQDIRNALLDIKV
jgi:Protein of unknown function (DUF3486)